LYVKKQDKTPTQKEFTNRDYKQGTDTGILTRTGIKKGAVRAHRCI
jgi:hypothetical protein